MANPTIYISAGEPSGDLYGAYLAKALKKKAPQLRLIGMGSRQMREAGVEIIEDISPWSTVGFWEPVKYLPKLWAAFQRVKTFLIRNRPDLVVVIDTQGFHLPLLKQLKKHGIPTAYYISPQEWQWGTEQGGRKVVEVTDLFLNVFKKAETFYKKLGGNAVFVGHPILDTFDTLSSRYEFYDQLKLDEALPVLSIFPGSRHHEIDRMLPVFLSAAQKMREEVDFQTVVSVAVPSLKSAIEAQLDAVNLPVKLYEGNPKNIMANSFFSLAKSGTVTLEHALLETPCVVGYRVSPLTYWVAKQKLEPKWRETSGFISLPNIFLREMVYPEFIQDACSVEAVVQAALPYLKDPAKREALKIRLMELRHELGGPGASDRAADAILGFISQFGKGE